MKEGVPGCEWKPADLPGSNLETRSIISTFVESQEALRHRHAGSHGG